MFKVPQTAKVIMEMRPQLIVSSDRLEEPGIKFGIPGYKASGLSTTPQRLLGLTLVASGLCKSFVLLVR